MDAIPAPPDTNHGPKILAVCWSMVGLALATVALRIGVRVRIVRKMGLDDYCMIAAMVVMLVEMIIIVFEVHYGAGRHVAYIKPKSNIVTGLHLNFVTQPLCLIGLCLTKISVGFFLLRLTPSKRYKMVINSIMVFTVLSWIGNFLTVFFQCRPLAFVWDPTVPNGYCIPPSNLKIASYFNSAVSALTDFVFALLPIPMLWNVQMNWKVKSAVAGILSLGIFATAAAIVKITYLGSYGKHGDFLYDSSDITIWTTVEICIAIMAASIPCLKPLFRAILSGSSAQNYGSGYKSNGYVRNNHSRRTRSRSEPDGGDDVELYGRTRNNTTQVRAGLGSKMDSEESIIPQGTRPAEGITKTMQVSISLQESPPPEKAKSIL